VRLPFAREIGEDEAFFALVADRWLAGLWPYAASFDVKPPGLFAMFALAEAAFGASVATIKGLEIACVALVAFGLYLIGSRHISRGAGWFAAALYPVYSLTLSGVDAPTELLKGPFEVFAVLAVLEALRGDRVGLGWIAAAGLSLGAAGTIKQTAIFPALALFAAILWRARTRGLATAATFGGGLLCAPLGFALLFWIGGHLPELLSGAVVGAAGRLNGDNISFIGGLERFFPLMRPLLALLVAGLLLLTRWTRIRRGPLALGASVVVAWLVGEAVGIIAVRAMYDHYFLALAPPLLLAAGITVRHLIGDQHERRLFVTMAASALALAVPLALDRRKVSPDVDTVAAARAAQRLSDVGVPRDGHILVLGRGLLVYIYSERQPGARYFHPQHLLCDFPAPDSDPLATALSENPSALIVNHGVGMVCERDDRWAEALAAIKADYCYAAQVSSPPDRFDILVARKDRAAPCPATFPESTDAKR
jgi:hypothetical protein